MIFRPQEQINQYKVLRYLGDGGMGEVYLVEEDLTGRLLALKTLFPHLTNDPQLRDRFVNEARIMSSLNNQNIVQIYGFFNYHQNFCMVMEYISGGSLRDLIHRVGPIYEQRAMHIFQQIAFALAYAHSKGVVHRDIKPGNIMLDENDLVKVMDFGIARVMESSGNTRTGSRLGTLVYMSPEQVHDSKNIDQKSDVYSLGVTLYHMLTGATPYDETTDSEFVISEKIVYHPLPDPRQRYPYISDPAIHLLQQLTQKDPRLRPSAAQIATLGLAAPNISPSPQGFTKPVQDNKQVFRTPATVNVPATSVAEQSIIPAKKASHRVLLTLSLILIVIGVLTFGYYSRWFDIRGRDDYYDGPTEDEIALDSTLVDTLAYYEVPAPVAEPKIDDMEEAVTEEPKPYEAAKKTVSEPQVEISRVWLEHSVSVGGKFGMNVHPSFRCYNLSGSSLEVSCYFNYADGNKVWDANQSYCANDGQVAATQYVYPGSSDYYFDNVSIFIPYDELHQSSGTTSLKTNVYIWYGTTSLAISDWTSFTITVP